MSRTWKIGVAGLGTVGGGLIKFLSERPNFAPAGGTAVVTGVSARSKSRPRDFDILNASLNRLAWDGSALKVLQWGDVTHLEALALDEIDR